MISSDSWGRRRTEGYGYFTLPTNPGLHEIVVQCWRPTGNAGYGAVQAQLRRYFIGHNPELEDVTYTAIPSGFEVCILVKITKKNFLDPVAGSRKNTACIICILS